MALALVLVVELVVEMLAAVIAGEAMMVIAGVMTLMVVMPVSLDEFSC